MKQDYPEEYIDLMMISHFDRDHINGIDELLRNYKVRYWLLPYYPLWKRLLVAHLSGINQENELFSFYLDPVNYLKKKYGDSLKECTFLLLPEIENKYEKITSPTSEINNDNLWFKEIKKDFKQDESYSNAQHIKLLDPYYSLLCNDVEFVPYNVPLNTLNLSGNILQNIQPKIDTIIKNSNNAKAMIQNLTKLYDSTFGKRNRNKISLFVYVNELNSFGFSSAEYYQIQPPYTVVFNQITCKKWGRFKNAILYTGDGYLSNPTEWANLQKVLGNDRISNIFALQVMHHGASSNWYSGLASQIKPTVSIFLRIILTVDINILMHRL